MEITEKQKEILLSFGELLTYGNEKISLVEINARTRPKKYVLFCAMIATQSYSEAILKLMKPDNIYDKAAHVILRSVIETYINLNYIYSSRTKDHALMFMIESIKDSVNFANKHQTLWKKYSSWRKMKFGTIEKQKDWDKFKEEQQKIIDDFQKQFEEPLPPLPSLLDRAIAFDTQCVKKRKTGISKSLAIKRLERKSLEKYYVLYYKYFSQLAHLNMPGLQSFMKKADTGGITIEIDSDSSSIETVIPVTFIIYFTILNHFLRQFNVYDKEEFQKFKDMLKIIK